MTMDTDFPSFPLRLIFIVVIVVCSGHGDVCVRAHVCVREKGTEKLDFNVDKRTRNDLYLGTILGVNYLAAKDISKIFF